MWTEIFARFVTDQVAFVVHAYLLGGDVLATIVIGAGIVWEHGSPDVRKVADRLVIWGVVAETLCSVALFTFDEGISAAQQSKIITLESHLAARVLTPDQSALIISRLSKFSDIGQVRYAFMASSDEEIGLAIDLSDHVFSKLGWIWDDWPGILAPVAIRLPTQGKVIGSLLPLNGIQIQVLNPKLSDVEKTLIQTLRDAELENVRADPKLDAALEGENNPILIIIMIGMRPPLNLAE